MQKKVAAAATGDILSPPGKWNGDSALNGVQVNASMRNPAVTGTIKTGRNNREIPGQASWLPTD
jgi:hypothetical protein